MCSSSIPLEPGGVTVTVTAAGATPVNSDAGPEDSHPQNAEKKEDACRRTWGCESAWLCFG